MTARPATSEAEGRDQVTIESVVEVTRYERDVHDPADESGLALVETRLRERFSGGFVGTGIATHLRLERTDRSGTLICYERVRGELAGRSGAFLLLASAEMSADHYVHGRWEIVRGSGTEQLSGIRGVAAFTARADASSPTGWMAKTTLTYWFDPPSDAGRTDG